ncbi:glycoside hydrolase family 76 protein [Apiospora marii]|uniref:Mannan endo-1,6-alpha-mannosidase n=1 Tax=Apiospora marii TaxID=335849 RepID=A0ABR1S7Q7_9PEZI
MRFLSWAASATALLGSVTSALDVDWGSDDSVKSAASQVAYGMVKYYSGNNTGDVAGNLPDPYYWWEAGAMFGALIDYWVYTGDDTYNKITYQAMLHQAGDDHDYMPENQTRSLGNDDQGFWAMAAMTAAEANFENPPDGEPGWLALTQAVFNEYVSRWDTKDCGGGLRWQIWTFNNGYNYKNSISNGCFFNIAARLYRFTGDQKYADWAEKIFKWEQDVKFIDSDYTVRDGAGYGDGENCKEVNGALFSYNAGIFLVGAAHMYNITEDGAWKDRATGLAKFTAKTFFKDGVMYEIACEPQGTCNTDQQAFKGHLSRWMATTAQLVPETHDTLAPLLTSSAKAAVQQCAGTSSDFKGPAGQACGFSWLKGPTYDGNAGVGEQMNALSVIYSTLVDKAPAPFTSKTGGSSKGDPDAGSKDSGKIARPRDMTAGDRAGAGILTTLILAGLLGGMFLVTSEG